jgi:hypothetical protein
MYTYKFRLFFDDVDGFVRDYEIMSTQTFKDFHDVIVKSIEGLDGQELASFYICDRRWEKQQEITLIDMNEDDDENNSFADEETEDDKNIPKAIMSESVLSNFIDDPHQKLIYEYNFLNINTFYIELLKTFESEKKVEYPRCVHAVGEMQSKPDNLLIENVDLDEYSQTDEEENVDYYDEEDFKDLNDDIEF